MRLRQSEPAAGLQEMGNDPRPARHVRQPGQGTPGDEHAIEARAKTALEKTKWLMRGVVKGIGDYGNAFGIPTVGGEVFFDDCFNVNILVNANIKKILR